MTESQKKEIAVFRFGVICEFVTGANLEYGEKEQLLKQKCARKCRSHIQPRPGFPEARSWDGSGSTTGG